MQNLLWPCCLECYFCFNFVLVTFRKHFWLSKPKSKFCANRPKAGWRWKSPFGKISNIDSEARNNFQYTKIEREVKNNNVYHCPGLEFQYNQLSLWTKPSKYAKIQQFIFFSTEHCIFAYFDNFVRRLNWLYWNSGPGQW